MDKISKNKIKNIILQQLQGKTYSDAFKIQNELRELVDKTIDEVLMKNQEL